VGNGRILREGPFKSIRVQPMAGAAGGALSVALFCHGPAYEIRSGAAKLTAAGTAKLIR
jgi:hypothetical protein